MYTIYAISEIVVSTTDASVAVSAYQDELDAGTRPAIYRDEMPVVQIKTCADCGAVVLMTPIDVTNWLSTFGNDLNEVLCGPCIDRVLQRDLYLDQAVKESWKESWEEAPHYDYDAGHPYYS